MPMNNIDRARVDSRRTISTMELVRLVQAVRTLVALGRPMRIAVYDISSSHGLSLPDVQELVKLLN